MQVHEKLRQLRIDRNLSTRQVAGATGIDMSNINRYENGVRAIPAKDQTKLELFYQIAPGELAGSQVVRMSCPRGGAQVRPPASHRARDLTLQGQIADAQRMIDGWKAERDELERRWFYMRQVLDAMIAAYEGGATVREIGAEYDLTGARIHQLLVDAGCQLRARGPQMILDTEWDDGE